MLRRWCPLAEFDPHRLRAAIRAKASVDIVVVRPTRFEYGGRRVGPDGLISVPGEIADALLFSGRADLTDAERAALAAEGIATR